MFELSGVVKPFSGKGRELGYPTANIEAAPDTPEGLFVGFTEFEGKSWSSLIFIGAPITLGETKKRAESHILNFPDRDLYGQTIKVLVEKKLRDNQKFDTVEELKEQMQEDEKAAREYFKKLSEK